MAVNNLITLRKGIATEWSGQNPTLASGEPGYDGTNNVLKIGDGATAWNDLDPIALSSINEDGSPILGGELNLDNNDIVIDCRNETGSTIAAGTPVYVSGYYSNNGKPLIAPADASDTSKMPAFGILNSALNTDTEGTMGIMGVVSTVNTSSFGIGDVVYVASGGGLTNTKPILEDNLIQNLGRVLRVDASQGRILLLGAGRTNDVPNLDEGKIWVGSSGNTITSSTIHLDETNNRLGIGTASPQAKLDVNGTVQFDDLVRWEYPDKALDVDIGTLGYLRTYDEAGAYCGLGISTSSFNVGTSGAINLRFIGQGVERAKFDTAGNFVFNENGNNCDFRVEGDSNPNLLFTDASTDRVGIGKNNPAYLLDVNGAIGSNSITVGSDKYLTMGRVTGGTFGVARIHEILGSLELMAGANTAAIEITNHSVGTPVITMNPAGIDMDFIVEGDTDTDLIHADAANDMVGIGTALPSYKLDVNGDIGLTDSGFYASPTGVMVGTSGWLYNDGQTTLSHGNFSDNGDAQNSSYVLRTSTTNATFTTLQNNAVDVKLASNRTMMFTANIVARRTNGQDNAAYKIEGVLANDGYGASILGTPVKTILYESDSTWDVQAILSGGGAGASDYLLIQGKGAASKNINWVCKLDLVEVGGDISGYTESNALGIQENTIP